MKPIIKKKEKKDSKTKEITDEDILTVKELDELFGEYLFDPVQLNFDFSPKASDDKDADD